MSAVFRHFLGELVQVSVEVAQNVIADLAGNDRAILPSGLTHRPFLPIRADTLLRISHGFAHNRIFYLLTNTQFKFYIAGFIDISFPSAAHQHFSNMHHFDRLAFRCSRPPMFSRQLTSAPIKIPALRPSDVYFLFHHLTGYLGHLDRERPAKAATGILIGKRQQLQSAHVFQQRKRLFLHPSLRVRLQEG